MDTSGHYRLDYQKKRKEKHIALSHCPSMVYVAKAGPADL